MEFDLEELFSIIKSAMKQAQEDEGSFARIIDRANDEDRNIFVGYIVDGTGTSIESTIRYWNRIDDEAGIPVENRKPIKIYIDSPGGSLTDTFTAIDAIRLSKTPVYTINTGCAYSGGFFMFIAGHQRIAYPNSSFMFHEGSTASSQCDAAKFRNFADFYDRQLKVLKKIVLQYTNLTEEFYDKIHKDDYWLMAEDALEQGICDEITKELI